MLDSARQIERDELIAEWSRLHAMGHDNPRTYTRIAAACIGLCSQDAGVLRLYHAIGCDVLGLGADLWTALGKAHGADLPGLIDAALESLRAAAETQAQAAHKARQDALQRVQTSAAVSRAEELAGAPLLPPGFTIGGWDLVRLARAVQANPGDVRIAQVRQVFAAAVEAHRAGRLGEWIDAHPDVGADWPGRG